MTKSQSSPDHNTNILFILITLVAIVASLLLRNNLALCAPPSDDNQPSTSSQASGSSRTISEQQVINEANMLSANFLLRNHLPTSDPCHDFYIFACGNQPTSPNLNMIRSIDARVEQLLRDTVTFPIASGRDDANLFRLRQFLRSCEGTPLKTVTEALGPLLPLMNLCSRPTQTSEINQELREDQMTLLLNLFRAEMAGFSSGQASSSFPGQASSSSYQTQSTGCSTPSSADELDWVATSLHSAGLGINYLYFFIINVNLDSHDGIVRLRIKRKSPSNIDWDKSSYYINVLMNVMPNAVHRERTKVNQLINDLIEFRRELYRDWHQETTNYVKDFRLVTLGELKQMAPRTDWMRLLAGLTGKQLSETYDQIAIPHTDSITQIDQLIANTNRETLSNHIFFDMFESLIPYLVLVLTPTSERNCINIIKATMGRSLFIEYARHFVDVQARQEVTKFVELMRTELIDMIDQEFNYMTKSVKEQAKRIANSIRVIVGYQDELVDTSRPNVVDGFYSLIKDYFPQANILNNLLALNRLENAYSFKKLLGNRPTNEDELLFFYRDLTGPIAHTSVFMHTIFLHINLLNGFFYNRHRVQELNLGPLGFIIAHEFAHNFDSMANDIYKLNHNGQSWWDKETGKRFEDRTHCYILQYSQLWNEITNSHENGNMTLVENIADHIGYRLSYRTYLRWLNDDANTAHRHTTHSLPGLDHLNSKQLFWLSTVNFFCSSREDLRLVYITNGVHSLPAHRSNEPLKNLPEFSRDFSCPLDSRMNPRHKCPI